MGVFSRFDRCTIILLMLLFLSGTRFFLKRYLFANVSPEESSLLDEKKKVQTVVFTAAPTVPPPTTRPPTTRPPRVFARSRGTLRDCPTLRFRSGEWYQPPNTSLPYFRELDCDRDFVYSNSRHDTFINCVTDKTFVFIGDGYARIMAAQLLRLIGHEEGARNLTNPLLVRNTQQHTYVLTNTRVIYVFAVFSYVVPAWIQAIITVDVVVMSHGLWHMLYYDTIHYMQDFQGALHALLHGFRRSSPPIIVLNGIHADDRLERNHHDVFPHLAKHWANVMKECGNKHRSTTYINARRCGVMQERIVYELDVSAMYNDTALDNWAGSYSVDVTFDMDSSLVSTAVNALLAWRCRLHKPKNYRDYKVAPKDCLALGFYWKNGFVSNMCQCSMTMKDMECTERDQALMNR
eukprot:PhF_6_TR13586/c0_g1_i1/m.21729